MKNLLDTLLWGYEHRSKTWYTCTLHSHSCFHSCPVPGDGLFLHSLKISTFERFSDHMRSYFFSWTFEVQEAIAQMCFNRQCVMVRTHVIRSWNVWMSQGKIFIIGICCMMDTLIILQQHEVGAVRPERLMQFRCIYKSCPWKRIWSSVFYIALKTTA